MGSTTRIKQTKIHNNFIIILEIYWNSICLYRVVNQCNVKIAIKLKVHNVIVFLIIVNTTLYKDTLGSWDLE